jgi:hypothetical protein
MTVFGKRLSDYVAFAKVFLGVILVVGILRLALRSRRRPSERRNHGGHGDELSVSSVVDHSRIGMIT